MCYILNAHAQSQTHILNVALTDQLITSKVDARTHARAHTHYAVYIPQFLYH